MNSRLLPLWQNKSLCKTIRLKMHVTCTFILLKIKSFSCEMCCMSIRSKERPRHNETVKWKLNLHMSQVAHQVGTYSGFCSMYQLGVFLLPPSPPPPPSPHLRWDASPSQGYMYLTISYLPVPIYPPDWKQAVRVQWVAQEHNTLFPPRARGLEASLLRIEKKYKNQVTCCFHGQIINFKMDKLGFLSS